MTIELLAERDVLKEKVASLQLALDKVNEELCYLGCPEYTYNLDDGRDLLKRITEAIVYEHYDDLKKQILDIKEVIKHSDLHYLEGYTDALSAVEGMINKWEEELD